MVPPPIRAGALLALLGAALLLPSPAFAGSGCRDAGLLFDPKSVASIKQAILKIVRDPEAARRLGKKGQDRMLAMTPERFGAELQVLLHELR